MGTHTSHAPDLLDRLRELERLVEILERGKGMWQSTFDAIEMPVHIVHDDFHIERANTTFARVSETDIRNVPGKHCYEIFAGRTSPCDGCPLTLMRQSGHPATTLLKGKIRNRQYEATAYPYAEQKKGKPSMAIVSYRDVTIERRLQQEVIQQEKMAAIGMLAGGVAHEINNPLGGVLAFTQLLLKEVKDQTIHADLVEIKHAAERCKRIVADLLDFARSSKEQKMNPVDVRETIEKIIPFIRGEMKSLNVEFELRGPTSLPRVMGHADKLQQVFLNIMTNACHAMQKGGKLMIDLSSAADGVLIAIRDTGTGIAEEHLSQIFDPFFTTKEPGKGTGLGLSISYRIIREHGGHIEVESTRGKGTAFVITLPEEARDPPSPKASARQGR